MGAAMFMPRDVFLDAGGWDEEFTFGGEDLDLSTRVGRQRQIIYLPMVEITHFGRMSTRQHISFAAPNMMAGFVRYLRKSGCSRLAVLAYKLVITIDAPAQMIEKSVQYIYRRLRRRESKAEKSLLAARGLAHFLLRGLLTFWRA